VTLKTGGALDLAGLGSFISSDTTGAGNAGGVTIDARSLSIANSSTIESSTFGTGNGGKVEVDVRGRLDIDGSKAPQGANLTGITASANAGSSGNAGTVTVNAGSL